MINRVEFFVEFIVWWVGLGILSSIGLGSGLQSGVLFMFPHVIRVCLAAQACKTVDFEANSNMWFKKTATQFKCPDDVVGLTSTPATFFNIWLKIIPVCFLQSAGTAIGEIPPYWMTRSARLAAIQAGGNNATEIPEELDSNSQFSWINRGKTWMINFLRTHGFYGVLIMASYPNIAFDLCGICCGHFLLPFWSFFGATFLGKAFIRNGYQSVLYVVLCSEKYVQMLIQTLQYLAPDNWNIDGVIKEILEDMRASFQNYQSTKANDDKKGSYSASTFLFWWQLFMGLLLFSFFVSCISQFAQHYQFLIDTEESNKLRSRLPNSVKLDLMSPTSGRLKLPPPSSHISVTTPTPHSLGSSSSSSSSSSTSSSSSSTSSSSSAVSSSTSSTTSLDPTFDAQPKAVQTLGNVEINADLAKKRE